MKKDELLNAIRNAGGEVNSRMNKEELQTIYDKLHVHRIKENPENPEQPEEVETPEEVEQPEEVETPEEVEQPEEVEPEVEPEKDDFHVKPEAPEAPEVEKPAADEFQELFNKIGGATPPEPKAAKDEPLITTKRRKTKKGESSPDATYINGYILLLVTDVVFPFAFAFINNLIDKKIKVAAGDLQLTEKDFTKLEPLADQAATYMSVNLNPVAGFLLVSTFMYSNNLMLVRMNKS